MRRVAVVGGGIAGLACAWDLARAGVQVKLLEASPRLGGKIESVREGGAVFEAGPDSFVTAKPWALELVRELGLGERLLPTNDSRKDVWVYTRGRLRRYPEGLMMLAPARPLSFLFSDLMSWRGKLRMGLERFVRGSGDGDESLGGFARRRFGDEALEVIVGPVLAGIYAGDPERLSLESTFPQLKALERKYGSVLKGLMAGREARARPADGTSLFMTLRGGLSELVEGLASRLPAGAALLGCPLSTLSRSDGGYRLRMAADELAADIVVLALPAPAASRVLAALDAGLSGLLARVPFSSTATVSLLYEGRGLEKALNGFGFVVDRREARTVMAATYSSVKFPGRAPEGKALIRCFLGGAGREEALGLSDEALAAAARSDLREIAGIGAEPLKTHIRRWPAANPQYNAGHGALLGGIEAALAAHPGLFLAGSSYRGVGIPDCIRSGREAARRILASGPSVPSGAIV